MMHLLNSKRNTLRIYKTKGYLAVPDGINWLGYYLEHIAGADRALCGVAMGRDIIEIDKQTHKIHEPAHVRESHPCRLVC